ncbi:hypothetical protein F5Y16DRAFT_164633 [Xylariaceae sp. FL0255]|nr:hypothetical protein F5Y16DRAFT_164633 [Xylariaceae sp. FL0255]
MCCTRDPRHIVSFGLPLTFDLVHYQSTIVKTVTVGGMHHYHVYRESFQAARRTQLACPKSLASTPGPPSGRPITTPQIEPHHSSTAPAPSQLETKLYKTKRLHSSHQNLTTILYIPRRHSISSLFLRLTRFRYHSPPNTRARIPTVKFENRGTAKFDQTCCPANTCSRPVSERPARKFIVALHNSEKTQIDPKIRSTNLI